MDKKKVIDYCNMFYAYHIGKSKIENGKFRLINKVETVAGSLTAYGVYFSFDKVTYRHKGKYLHSVALTIKNPYLTTDQIYSALIDANKKKDLKKKGYDSVALIKNDKIIEVIVFTNKQISIESVEESLSGKKKRKK